MLAPLKMSGKKMLLEVDLETKIITLLQNIEKTKVSPDLILAKRSSKCYFIMIKTLQETSIARC